MKKVTVTCIAIAMVAAAGLAHLLAQQAVSPAPAPLGALPPSPSLTPIEAQSGAPALSDPAPAGAPGTPAVIYPTPSATGPYIHYSTLPSLTPYGTVSDGSLPTAAPDSSVAVPPLVLQFTPGNSGFAATMGEDLAIMSRLFEKSLNQLADASQVSTWRIKFMMSGDRRSVRASYVEGFGALFMIKVSFPVLGPPQPRATSHPVAADSEWEQARRDLAAGPGPGFPGGRHVGGAPEYDAILVSNLMNALTQTLKNAAHIRDLKPEEYVAVTVFGAPLTTSVAVTGAVPGYGAPPAAPGIPAGYTGGVPPPPVSVARVVDPHSRMGTVLSLRVKRADIDAYSKGELTREAFESKLTRHTYVGSGYGITSLNSWVGE